MRRVHKLDRVVDTGSSAKGCSIEPDLVVDFGLLGWSSYRVQGLGSGLGVKGLGLCIPSLKES